jgi:hypothetical protein
MTWKRYWVVHGRFQPRCLVLLQRVQVVQSAEEQQVGDLFNHLRGLEMPPVEKASRDVVLDVVDLAANFACQHTL